MRNPEPPTGTDLGTENPERLSGRLSYMPGLDGIRAVAVLAIIFYHSGFTWLPGGYYSVDAFFVLSGFLITSLLVAEWNRRASISLSAFWTRRARRLLPGLFVMLAGVGALSAVWPGALASPHLRSDALATLAYVANWHFIAVHANYFFATSQPSPLLHTWTLAIEEQFYILWPLVVAAVLGRPRSRSRADTIGGPGSRAPLGNRAGEETGQDGRRRRARLRVLLTVSVAGALGSAVLMALLDRPGGDLTRLYYGTDTRAQSLLVGAALACAVALWKPTASASRRRFVSVAGVVGVIGTAALWTRVNEGSALAFRGGFLLAAISTAGVIACVAHLPDHLLTRVLSISPLTYLGRISYGVYLWYWPTLLVVDHAQTGLSGYPLVAARVAVVVALATFSYYLVEMPIRRGGLPGWRAAAAVPAAAGLALVSIFTATALVATPATASVALAAAPGTSGGVDLPVANAGSTPGAATTTTTTTTAGGSTPVAGSADPASDPVTVLLVGDSMAGSLGVGLQQSQGHYGVQVVNDGSPGCSVGMDGDFRVLWYTTAPGSPCVTAKPSALLDTWQKWVDTVDPDVAVYFARADLMDQSVGGTWEHVGSRGYDAFLEARLRAGVRVLSSRGAHVVLLTSPVYASGEQPSGSPWPEDDPSRVGAYNAVLRSVASQFPGTASLVDTGSALSPGGSTSDDVHGISARCPDHVHLSPRAGRWLAASILGPSARWGAAHAAARPADARRTFAAGPPSWYAKLNCP